jgi:hypothetical protein
MYSQHAVYVGKKSSKTKTARTYAPTQHKSTDILEVCTTSIFRVEEMLSKQREISNRLEASTVKLEAVQVPETLVSFYRTRRHYIPEDSTLHSHRSENPKSNILNYSLPNYFLLVYLLLSLFI